MSGDWQFNGLMYVKLGTTLAYYPSDWESYHDGTLGQTSGQAWIRNPKAFTDVFVQNVSPTNQQDPRLLTNNNHIFKQPYTTADWVVYRVDPLATNPPHYPV